MSDDLHRILDELDALYGRRPRWRQRLSWWWFCLRGKPQ